MKQILIIFLIFLASAVSFSQTLRGKIMNQQGEPIPHATVYISEIRQGTTANVNGDYAIKLQPGKYTVTFQSLSYEPVFAEVELSGETVTKNITLPMQYYQIPEVRITASGEDPAYIIMRKVIGMAPYYLNNISYYKAEVYLKGNLVINKIPRILKRTIEKQNAKGEEIPFKEGDVFFMESYNEIEFTAPDKYFQKVLSLNSTFPEEGNEISPMSFIQASFYEPEIAEMAISPLAPTAFSHYNFKYTGLSLQGDHVINKIQVTPKRKSQQLFEGTIFIIEDLWCLHSVDLVNENLVGKIRVRQLYVPVQNGMWMPVSHNFDVNIGIMGVRADANYTSSVKYTEVRPNTALKKPETIATNTSSFKTLPDTLPVTKTDEQINRILAKDELSNRDMMKLSKLMDKKSEKSLSDTLKKKLEVVETTVQKVEKDAGKKDSVYWSQVRPIPLSDLEKKSIRVSDSIKASSQIRTMKRDTTLVQETNEKPKKGLKTLRNIATGYTWNDNTAGWALKFGGLINLKSINFNTVDGFVYGVDFGVSRNYKNNEFSISPELKWAFGRQNLIWRVNSFYRFGEKHMNQVYLRTGHASVDFNSGGGINLFLNTEMSLLFRKNNLKLYESGYLTLGYLTTLMPGLGIDVSATYEDRGMLDNTTDFSLFRSSRNQYTENIPVNPYLSEGSYALYGVRDMRHARFTSTFDYTPFMRYRVIKDRKIPIDSNWPAFSVTWIHGINEFTELSDPIKHYDMLRFEVSKTHVKGAFNEFRWRLRTGGFLNDKYITFYDFTHVNTQPLPFLLNNYEDAFMLPAFYSMSTPLFYTQVFTRYTAPYIALKYLPFLSNTLMRENLSISYMGSTDGHYTEFGYALSEIFLLAEAGVYVGFKGFKYKSAGFSLVFKFN